MAKEDYPEYIYRKLGLIQFVHWPRNVIVEMATKNEFERYNISFTGIGIGGYYVGFLNGRLKSKPPECLDTGGR